MASRPEPTEFIEAFGALKRCLGALAAQAYAEAEIGSTQAKFLRHIGKHGRMSQAELARATDTDPTLTGRALQTLIERGWVRRKRSRRDRREYVLELSAAGARARRRVERLRAQLGSRVLEALEARDVADFDRIVKKVLMAFDLRDDRA
jgi:DNA-binding MarR family transcriptional regulator